MSSKTLYHITRRENLISIEENGIDPLMSRGKLKVVWLVRKSLVIWAIFHICKRDKLLVGQVSILQVRVSERQMVKTNKRGVWYVYVKPKITDVFDALYWDDPDWRKG